MERLEQIKFASRNASAIYEQGFIDGALWADKNPIDLNNFKIDKVFVKGGDFIMGRAPKGEVGCADEEPIHIATVDSFFIMTTPVTNGLWADVMGFEVATCDRNLPKVNVSWFTCIDFIHKLNVLTNSKYRLPTEAEWEYAARGGNLSKGYKYSGGNDIDEVGWHKGNCGSRRHTVKEKKPNELGLYDMSGNVAEWCQDWYGTYDNYSLLNPKGPKSGIFRVTRGGSWTNDYRSCRVSYRGCNNPGVHTDYIGFRLVC